MVRKLEDLPELQREIIRSLKPRRSNAISLPEIQGLLGGEGFAASMDEVRRGVKGLIEYGAVRGVVGEEGKGYYLSRGIGSGYRNQGTLMGRTNPFRDSYKFLKRMFGSTLIIFGLGFFIYQNTVVSGAAVSSGTGSSSGYIILSLGAILIGSALLFASRNKKRKK